MSEKADHRLLKLASFGSTAGRKQADSSRAVSLDAKAGSPTREAAPAPARAAAPMIRNIAFTVEEQKILRDLMEALRGLGEMSPNLSLAVKVGLRLVPTPIPADALHAAVSACKALDGRRKEARRSA